MGRNCEKQKVDFEKRIKDAKNDLATGKYTEISEAAEVHGLARSTLSDRLGGGLSRQEARTTQQNLTPIEEAAIKRWILKLDDWRFPPRYDYVKNMALDFLKSHGLDLPVLGKNWLTRFLSRHPDLASKFSNRLDKQHSFANNPKILQDFFDKLRKVIQEHSILPEYIYNMDEKGFLMGQSARVKVICWKGKRRNFKTQEGQRELITVIETISAGGFVTPPTIIYKGEAQYKGWHALVTAEDKTFFSQSSTGWTNSSIGLSYLQKNFNPSTSEHAADKTHLLILDGHVSHCTWQFFAFCLAHNIIPICLPAHSTHLLQPLDVVLFGRLQKNYGDVLDEWLQDGNVGISKGTFYPLLLNARNRTYTTKNILSAFECTGISPLNPRRVLKSVVCTVAVTTNKELIPHTPRHGKSIASHTRCTLALLQVDSDIHVMVKKLATGAAEAAAEVVILKQELEYLRKKNKAATDALKTQSRKVLSKALEISASDVVRLREQSEEKERQKSEKEKKRIEKAIEKKGVAIVQAITKPATGKPRGRPKKLTALQLPFLDISLGGPLGGPLGGSLGGSLGGPLSRSLSGSRSGSLSGSLSGPHSESLGGSLGGSLSGPHNGSLGSPLGNLHSGSLGSPLGSPLSGLHSGSLGVPLGGPHSGSLGVPLGGPHSRSLGSPLGGPLSGFLGSPLDRSLSGSLCSLKPELEDLDLDKDESECVWQEVDEIYFSEPDDEYVPIYTPPQPRVKRYLVRESQPQPLALALAGTRVLRPRK